MYQKALTEFLADPENAEWSNLSFFRFGAAEKIAASVDRRIAYGAQVLPAADHVFNALRLATPANTRVVILGQDPYPTPGHAHGLAFSYVGGGALPASLRNIFKELASDLGGPLRTRGDLTDWARQGVLLLNTALTVEAGAAGAHMKLGWQELTRQAVKAISDASPACAFVLWGAKAAAYADLIDPAKHLILTSAHPSPLSAHNGFFGSKPFSKVNAWLGNRSAPELRWLET